MKSPIHLIGRSNNKGPNVVKGIYVDRLHVVGQIGPLARRGYDGLADGMMCAVPQNVAGHNLVESAFPGDRCRSGRCLERHRVTP